MTGYETSALVIVGFVLGVIVGARPHKRVKLTMKPNIEVETGSVADMEAVIAGLRKSALDTPRLRESDYLQ